MEPAVGAAGCWLSATPVEAREQGHGPHSKGCRKMAGVTCGVRVGLGLCRSWLEKEEGKGAWFGRGIKRIVVLGH